MGISAMDFRDAADIRKLRCHFGRWDFPDNVTVAFYDIDRYTYPFLFVVCDDVGPNVSIAIRDLRTSDVPGISTFRDFQGCALAQNCGWTTRPALNSRRWAMGGRHALPVLPPTPGANFYRAMARGCNDIR